MVYRFHPVPAGALWVVVSWDVAAVEELPEADIGGSELDQHGAAGSVEVPILVWKE